MTTHHAKTMLLGILLANATAYAAIPVVADEKLLADACQRINLRQEDVISQVSRLHLDASQVKLGMPTDSIHGQSTEKYYAVDELSYVNLCNSYLVNGGEHSVKLLSIDVQTGDTGMMAEEPVFIFELRVADGAGTNFLLRKQQVAPNSAIRLFAVSIKTQQGYEA